MCAISVSAISVSVSLNMWCKHVNKCDDNTYTTILRSLYMSACVSWNLQLRNGGFCWSKVLLYTCLCWWQLENRPTTLAWSLTLTYDLDFQSPACCDHDLLTCKGSSSKVVRSFVRSLRGDCGSSGWYANPQYSAEAITTRPIVHPQSVCSVCRCCAATVVMTGRVCESLVLFICSAQPSCTFR